MAYAPTEWKDNDLITAERLNKLEQGVKNEQVGTPGKQGDPGTPGAPGTPGKGVKALSLTADASGKVTGGTVTFSDNTTAAVTVTQA